MDMENKKILLIEDDQFARELYEEVLKDAGFEVDTAVDGVDGLSKMTLGGYNLILLDVMMPKMDGLDVLRELMNNPPKVKNGPIVLLTNLTNDPVIDTAYGLNAKWHLVKASVAVALVDGAVLGGSGLSVVVLLYRGGAVATACRSHANEVSGVGVTRPHQAGTIPKVLHLAKCAAVGCLAVAHMGSHSITLVAVVNLAACKRVLHGLALAICDLSFVGVELLLKA